MRLALFDLDNTLLAGDSDYLWGRFLVELEVVDGDHYERENQRFFDDYKAGRLDIFEFLSFSLQPLRDNDPHTLLQWRERFVREVITPLVTEPALELVAQHRAQGDLLMIITATNRFVTAPIAELFGIDRLLATEPEQIDGRYTGRVAGVPCFQKGKVERLREWLSQSGATLDDSWFYSDSHNDLPLLELVEHPVAVDPDPQLRTTARERGWQILSLHGGSH